MVPPVKPVKTEDQFQRQDVKTGFSLPNGKDLPFWHVMFGSLTL